jgi:hypothetical protein
VVVGVNRNSAWSESPSMHREAHYKTAGIRGIPPSFGARQSGASLWYSPRETLSKHMRPATRRYLANAIGCLLSIVIIVHLTLAQRFYLSRSDTGKPWAVLTAWLGLLAWFMRVEQMPKASRQDQNSNRLHPYHNQRGGDLDSLVVR